MELRQNVVKRQYVATYKLQKSAKKATYDIRHVYAESDNVARQRAAEQIEEVAQESQWDGGKVSLCRLATKANDGFEREVAIDR